MSLPLVLSNSTTHGERHRVLKFVGDFTEEELRQVGHGEARQVGLAEGQYGLSVLCLTPNAFPTSTSYLVIICEIAGGRM